MTLRSSLGAVANQALGQVGAFLTPQTSAHEVAALIRRLSPQRTDRPLIRLGPDGDGGYLLPDDLDGIATCFSPGVSSVSGFELDCARRGMTVFLADASVTGPAEVHPAFHFSPKFVGAVSTEPFMTIDEWVRASGAPTEGDLLLQMDIETAEYEVLLAMSPELLRRFRIVVIEFHQLEELWNRAWFGLASRAFAKLLETHVCVHIHPNNSRGVFDLHGLGIPRDAEFTFIRRDRVRLAGPASEFPHPLDRDCTSVPTPPLPRCWIGTPA